MVKSFNKFIALGVFSIAAVLAASSAQAANRFWYGSPGCSGGGGDGYWAQQGTAVGLNWRVTDDGTCPGSTYWASADDAVFGGAAGTVTVRFSANFNANSVRVKTDGYKFFATGGSAATFILATGRFTVDTGMTTMTTGVNVQTLRWGVASPNPFILNGFGTLNMSVAANSVIGADKIWITNATLITVGSGSLPNTPGAFSADIYKLETNATIFYKGYSPVLGVNYGVTIGASGGRIQTDTGNASFLGVFTGGGILTKLGAGKLTLGGNNGATFTGSNWVSAGTLSVTNNNALGDTAASTQVSSGGALELNNAAATIYAAEPLVLNGTGVNQGGALVNTANNHTWTGPITLGSSGVQINSTAQLLVISGGISGAGNPNLVLAGAGNLSVSNVNLSIGSGKLTKTNSGTLSLLLSNSFSGGFLISGGSVNFNDNNSAGSGAITVTPVSATTLRVSTTAVTISNAITVNPGTSTIDLLAPSGNAINFSGNISGTAPLTRGAGGGAGIVTLSGDNSGWSGGMTHQGGILALGHPNSLGTSNLNIVGTALNTTLLQASTALTGVNAVTNSVLMNTNLIVNGVNDLELSGPVSLLLLPRSISISNITTLSGPISGTGFTKTGTGTLIIKGTNAYTGGTIVSGGTLDAQGDGAFGSGNVTVLDGATNTLELGVTNGYISSSASLILTGAAPVVNLNYTGTPNTIHGLSFDGGVSYASAGTWGAPGSGATFTDARFTGTGLLNVTVGASVVDVTSVPNPSVYGSSVTFTGTVSVVGGPATGNLTFKDGATTLGTAALDGSGQATFTTNNLAVTSHSITAFYPGDGFFNPGVSAVYTQIVTAATLQPSASVSDKVYNGTTNATITARALVGILFGDSVSLGVSGSAAFVDKNAGAGKTVNVTGLALSGASATNYVLSSTTYVTNASITEASLTVTAAGVNKPYDGNNTATVNLSDNRVAGDSVTDSYTAATFSDSAVGNGKTVNVTGISISGPDAPNYILQNTTASTTANITPAPLTVTGITASDKVYDATTNATINVTNAVLLGVVGAEDVQLSTTNAVGGFTNTTVGVAKTVLISGLSIFGADIGNYTLLQPSTNASITKAPLTVTANNANRVYSAPDPSFSAGYATFVGSDTASVVQGAPGFSTTATNGSAPGVYPLTPSLGTLSATNYDFTAFVDGTLTIAQAGSSNSLASSLNPSTNGDAVTFTATITAVAPSTGAPGGNVVFKSNGTPFSTNAITGGAAAATTSTLPAGTNTISAEYAGDTNFTGSTNSLQQAVVAVSGTCSSTNVLLGISANLDGTFTLSFQGTPQAEYYVQVATNLTDPVTWAVLGGTNAVTNLSGLWSATVTNNAPQSYYRAAAVSVCP